MKMCYAIPGKDNTIRYNFNCGDHIRFGKSKCFSHYITAKVLEEIILDDNTIRDAKKCIDEMIRLNHE